MRPQRKQDGRRVGAGRLRAAAWLIFLGGALVLALFSAANLDVLWEKGLELFISGSDAGVQGVATDVISMVAARDFSFSGRFPAAAPLAIHGRDVFIAYDPLLRSEIELEMRSASVEARLLPAPPLKDRPLPLFGLFRRFAVACPDAAFNIRWSDYAFECASSRIKCESAEGEDGVISWEIPSLKVRKGENPLAVLGEVAIAAGFKREGAVCVSPLVSGSIRAKIGRAELDMEALSAVGNRERFLVTGTFSGAADFAIEDGKLTRAEAALVPRGKGLVSISRDFIDDYLAGIPQGARRDSMKIVLEKFQDYTFNRGELRLKLAGDTVTLNADLEGEGGPRIVELNFYDFLKEGRLAGKPVPATRR